MLAGCAGNESVKPANENAAKSTATTASADIAGKQLSEQDKLLAQRNTYFAFDDSTIDANARDLIKAHAQHLVAQPNIAITLEGHADERGTREYNLRLGERRAQAVAKNMQALGVAKKRIAINSLGKEKPVCTEHDEACWQKNRRVEISYR
jgi:peptidoglycan-associated lipoprotein